MKLPLDPKDCVGRRQDGVWDATLEAALRAAPEEMRVEFLSRVLVLQEEAGKSKRPWFDLAGRVLADPDSYGLILRAGLSVADVSSIKGWLECCIQRMGMRQTIRVLRDEDAAHRNRVDLVSYWLPRLARSPKERAAVAAFLAGRAASQKDSS